MNLRGIESICEEFGEYYLLRYDSILTILVCQVVPYRHWVKYWRSWSQYLTQYSYYIDSLNSLISQCLLCKPLLQTVWITENKYNCIMQFNLHWIIRDGSKSHCKALKWSKMWRIACFYFAVVYLRSQILTLCRQRLFADKTVCVCETPFNSDEYLIQK